MEDSLMFDSRFINYCLLRVAATLTNHYGCNEGLKKSLFNDGNNQAESAAENRAYVIS